MTSTTELDPSAGFYLRGVEVDDHTFVAAVEFRQLRAVTRDPMLLQNGGTRRDEDPELESDREIHDLVQRAVTGTKKKNVGSYADYITGILNGKNGVLPPIHLWTQERLDSYITGHGTFVLVPLGQTLISIDGETQLTAHWRIATGKLSDYDKELKALHARMPLSVVVHHDVPTRVARQYFHDLNILAVRPNTGIGLAMDTSDPVMKIVEDVQTLPVLEGRVDRQARQLAKRSEKLVTLSALRQMVIDIAHGISGIQYGSRPAPTDEDVLRRLGDLAPDVVEAYFSAFEHQIADRENYIAGTAPVLAAIGALAHDLLDQPHEARSQGIAAIITSLHEVDWSRNETWQGIAGDFTSRGVFSVKGTKEVAYAVFNALSDSRNPSYARVRHLVVTAAPVFEGTVTGGVGAIDRPQPLIYDESGDL